MQAHKKRLVTIPTAAKTEIKDQFEKCRRKEQDWLDQTATHNEIARQSLFDESRFTPLTGAFDSNPQTGSRSYKEFIDQLKTADDDRRVRYWLGQWLKAEGIRDPIKFFPAGIIKSLRQLMQISGADLRNVEIVRIWLPYTEPLLRKARWLRKDGETDLPNQLKRIGYDSKMVSLLAEKNWISPVEFTCEWVARHTSSEFQQETLVNSYSRYRDRWRSTCSFCMMSADGEFWVRGEPVPYCHRHRPDLLPTSAATAWADHKGRGWWLDGLDIRYTNPSRLK